MRLDVLEDSIEAHPYAPATPLSPAIAAKLPYPLVLVPRAKFSYYAPPETFDIMAMVKSPMVLMMIATAVMVLAMPYLMVCCIIRVYSPCSDACIVQYGPRVSRRIQGTASQNGQNAERRD